MDRIINNRTGKLPPAMLVSGFIFFAVGLLTIYKVSVLAGIGLALVGGFIYFSYDGVQIDVKNKRYREYTNLFGLFKIGKWNTLERYPYLTILKYRRGNIVHGKIASKSSESTFFEIYLLDETHRNKLLIKRHSDIERAKRSAEIFEEELNVLYTEYNPVVSAKTRKNRYKNSKYE